MIGATGWPFYVILSQRRRKQQQPQASAASNMRDNGRVSLFTFLLCMDVSILAIINIHLQTFLLRWIYLVGIWNGSTEIASLNIILIQKYKLINCRNYWKIFEKIIYVLASIIIGGIERTNEVTVRVRDSLETCKNYIRLVSFSFSLCTKCWFWILINTKCAQAYPFHSAAKSFASI